MSGEPVILTSYKGPERNIFDDIQCAEAENLLQPDGPLSSKSYVLCFVERSGSTMLAEMMGQTRLLGQPIEYLNPRGPMWWALQEAPAKNLSQYFDKLRRRTITANGVFGMKAAYVDFRPVIDAGMVDSLLGQPCFIYLTRKDVVLQAISYFVAQKRDLWHSDQRPRKLDQGLNPDGIDVEFDRDQILKLVDRILNYQLCWERFFGNHGVEPLRIEYENLVPENMQHELERICRFIGIESSFSVEELSTSLEIMRDEKALEWAERIRSEFMS